MMSCVMRSPSCSHMTTSRASSAPFGPVLEHLLQQLRRPDDVGSCLFEQVEERVVIKRQTAVRWGGSMARSRSSSSGAMPYACSGAGNARVRTSSAYSRTPRTISVLTSA
jgi:hypothetical protein